LASTDPVQFDPYPGRFLRDDVEEQALAALQSEATPEATARFGPPETIVAQARRHAVEAVPCYFEFTRVWPRLMQAVRHDASQRERLSLSFGQPV
jgi:hypothetical protein